MKRILSMILALALLPVLTACGERPAGAPNPQPEGSAVEVDGEPADDGDGLAGIVSSAVLPEEPVGPEPLRLVVPEGYTLARIGMTLEDMGVCTAEEFIAAAQEGDFSEFSLVAALPPNPNRCFALEGYLFPATYEIYPDEAPDAIIRRMLARTEQAFTSELRSQIELYDMTVEEVVILASIIQKEAFGDGVMPAISSVLHNRLDIAMQLQCDVTITYVEGAIKPFIDGDIDRYNEYYNTYKCPALPAGPICNPGMPAIRAAVDPVQSDYLYFLTDPDQNYYFTADYDEHLANVAEHLG